MLLPICFCRKRHEPVYKRSVVSLHTVFQKSISVHLRSLLWFTLLSRPDFLSLSSSSSFFVLKKYYQHNLSICLSYKIICNCQSRNVNFFYRYLSRDSALYKKCRWWKEEKSISPDFTFLTIYTIKMTEFSGRSRHRGREKVQVPTSNLRLPAPTSTNSSGLKKRLPYINLYTYVYILYDSPMGLHTWSLNSRFNFECWILIRRNAYLIIS